MKVSQYSSYDDLPLFLNAKRGPHTNAAHLCGAPLDFPILKVGSCMVVPKKKFIQWVEENTKGVGGE